MNYEEAKKSYAIYGVDTDGALAALDQIPISIHCWQGDDVLGFEDRSRGLSGGIQTTGNYPGRARTPAELMADFDEALTLIPGKKRLSLHASYAVFDGAPKANRDAIAPEHFRPWVEYARARGLGLDFNPTFFSHPMAESGFTLSSQNREVRAFWVRHGIACREIAAYFAAELGTHCLCNVWIPDGLKDVPADRLSPRLRLKESLDEIFDKSLPGVVDSVESKVFGIGVESYTVGSSEFYACYAMGRPGVYPLLDNGHYHPTEKVSDKISSMLVYFDKLPLHVTRPVRWDSDHVVLLEDELIEIAKELVRNDALDRALIGLDFFDASINRIAAWATGTRSMQKALLYALLQPNERLRRMQEEMDYTGLMLLQEALKTLPFGTVWERWCETQGAPVEQALAARIQQYEQRVLRKRG